MVGILGLAALAPACGPDLGKVGGMGAGGIGDLEWDLLATLGAGSALPAHGSLVARTFPNPEAELGVVLLVASVTVKRVLAAHIVVTVPNDHANHAASDVGHLNLWGAQAGHGKAEVPTFQGLLSGVDRLLVSQNRDLSLGSSDASRAAAPAAAGRVLLDNGGYIAGRVPSLVLVVVDAATAE